MTALNRHSGYSHYMDVGSTSMSIGHAMTNKRICTRCKKHKLPKGGTNKNGMGFVCADCRPRVV